MKKVTILLRLCLYIIVLPTLTYFTSVNPQNNFFTTFINSSLLSLLVTLTAIYMTSISLIAVELNRLSASQKNIECEQFISELKSIFIMQIILIIISFITFILKDYLLIRISNYSSHIIYISNYLFMAVFSYFIEALYDMGKTLFLLIATRK